jgi:hypothetical protein
LLAYKIVAQPVWRNGRRNRLKIDRPKGMWVRLPPPAPTFQI